MSERTKTAKPKKRKRPAKPGRFLTASERIIVCDILDTIIDYGMKGLLAAQEALIRTKDKEMYGEQHSMYAGVVAGAKWGKSNADRIRVLAKQTNKSTLDNKKGS